MATSLDGSISLTVAVYVGYGVRDFQMFLATVELNRKLAPDSSLALHKFLWFLTRKENSNSHLRTQVSIVDPIHRLLCRVRSQGTVMAIA
ncbi:hypothetical protein V6N11_064278 [Hibiscus sabdariffa]|uniref:Uncharacterized protein n=1 Tax=Hibiscus sabdariffa TaxID=183260 RepID=A0ABR2PN75_9ROSI